MKFNEANTLIKYLLVTSNKVQDFYVGRLKIGKEIWDLFVCGGGWKSNNLIK